MVKFLQKRLLPSVKGPDLDAKVRAALVSTLYSSPTSLALGALCGLASSIYVAMMEDEPILLYTALVLTVIVAGRIIAAFAFHHDNQRDLNQTKLLEFSYEAGAWAYAAGLGIIAGLTVALANDVQLHVLAAVNTVGYAAGVSGRNAGRPRIAVGQNLLASLPLAIGLMWEGSWTYWLLAATTVVFFIAVTSITLRTHDIVHASFVSAEANARLAEDMRTFATTDPVTGLSNRAGLETWLTKVFEQDEPEPFGLFWFDLDRFKEVNDTLGHPFGDKVLQEVARRLKTLCEPDMVISRFGGDEFVIVAPGLDRAEADSFGRLLLTVIRQQLEIEGTQVGISASLGIALCPEDATTAAALMQQADMALYASKLGGRSQQNFFHHNMDAELHRRRQLESELRTAISSGDLRLHYQPIIDLESERIVAMEALVRWIHPERGMLNPDDFVAIAESTGLIITMGNWIVLEACRAAARWPDHVKVAVNVSPVQMQAPGAALGFLNALKVSGLPAHRLELEITENVFADQTDHVLEFIRLTRAAGIGLTLDDFGTGYSSLSYIRDFDFSKIKIDRSFISGQSDGERATEVVKAVAGLAAGLHIPLVAEGVETAEDAQRCIRLGCTQGQGFLYSRGVPLDEATLLIERNVGADGIAAVRAAS